MADDISGATAHCHVTVLGACHSGAGALTTALRQALDAARYTIDDASVRWLHADAAIRAPATALHCCLLMGLDLACPLAWQARQQHEDAHLRMQLATAGPVFRVVYGRTPMERLAQALQAIDAVAPCAVTRQHRPPSSSPRLRPWGCEQCSDPDCERRLFSALRGESAGS